MKPTRSIAARMPAFIPESLWQAKPSFVWKSGTAHMGPPHTANALYKKFSGHSYCSVRALMGGILQWSAAAFASVRDVRSLLDLAEIHFLTMAPIHYKDVDWDAIFERKKPQTDKFDAALREIFWLGAQALAPGAWLDSEGTASRNAFHMIYLVRHVLDATHRRVFDRWLDVAMNRTKKGGSTKFKAKTGHAARDKSWGHPLPFGILEHDVPPKDLIKGRETVVSSIVAHKNDFYVPCSSYLKKLSSKETAALKSRGITAVQHLASHTKQELTEALSEDDNAIYVLRIELAAQNGTFATKTRS